MYRLQCSWDEDMSLLEKCPHFRGCCVQASMELGRRYVPIREVSSFQMVLHVLLHVCI